MVIVVVLNVRITMVDHRMGFFVDFQELGVYLTGATEAPVGGLGHADMQMPKQSYIVCRVEVVVVKLLVI